MLGRSLAAEDSGDAGRDGPGEDLTDGDEQIREPPLRSLRVVGIPHAEVNEGHDQVEGVDQRVEGRVRTPLSGGGWCRPKARVPRPMNAASHAQARNGR
jgi:hypothetical protein